MAATLRQSSQDPGGRVGPPRVEGRGLGRVGEQVRTTTPRRPRAASPGPRDPRDLGAVAAAVLRSAVRDREWTDGRTRARRPPRTRTMAVSARLRGGGRGGGDGAVGACGDAGAAGAGLGARREAG